MMDALTTAGATLRMPVNMARNSPSAGLLLRAKPSESDMLMESGASMTALTDMEGTKGPMRVPAAKSPITWAR